MLGVFDKFISIISSECPPKIGEFIENIICIFIIMIVETESTKCQPVDIRSHLFKIVYQWAYLN
jgi:hypothetical protein